MSGHSKWSKVKHQKETTDAVKSSHFTKAARAITMAVKEGGGITDPDKNFKLRLAVEKAKSVNMPKENISRAIAKGQGNTGDNLVQLMYEAIGPGNTAILISCATDNTNRTISLLKSILEHNGAAMVSQGAVRHLFKPVGSIVVRRLNMTEDAILNMALEFNIEDYEIGDQNVYLYTDMNQLHHIREKIASQGIEIIESELIMAAQIKIDLDQINAEKLGVLVDKIEECDDVQEVFVNAS